MHDRIAGDNSDFEEAEKKIMNETFFNILTKTEQTILQMSLENKTMPEICDVTNLSPDNILAIGKKINRKKKSFFSE